MDIQQKLKIKVAVLPRVHASSVIAHILPEDSIRGGTPDQPDQKLLPNLQDVSRGTLINSKYGVNWRGQHFVDLKAMTEKNDSS